MTGPIIIMGVAGSGKTTVGSTLATRLKRTFIDADDFHPEENIRKMSEGLPLEDEDRAPWLEILNHQLKENQEVVLACSALKEAYRATLSDGLHHIKWVYLEGEQALIYERLIERKGHFMEAGMLESQFETLEIPEYSLKVNISDSVDKQVNLIEKDLEKSGVGLIGLGVMGGALVQNLLDHQWSVSVFNPTVPGEVNLVTKFLKDHAKKSLTGFTSLSDFINSLQRPRKILLMIKSGEPVDRLLEEVEPLLEEGDLVADLGNSFYKYTERREEFLKGKGKHFAGVGVSGGEDGARNGASIMAGGSKISYSILFPILKDLSIQDRNGLHCVCHTGPGGSGHYVKMIHNGLEYVEMQLLAELYHLLSQQFRNEAIADLFEEWNAGDLQSYLLEITVKVLRMREGDHDLLDLILDEATGKGTGTWSVRDSFQLGAPANMMAEAVVARTLSSSKELRKLEVERTEVEKEASKTDMNSLEKAYRAARIINHQQGFHVLKLASEQYDWILDLSEIARIWTNGCIIRSKLMEDCAGHLRQNNLLLQADILRQQMVHSEEDFGKLIQSASRVRIPTPCFSSAWNYWLTLRSDRLPANIIQAQRDYFGRHGFYRTGNQTELDHLNRSHDS